MRIQTLSLTLLLSSALAGCIEDGAPPPDMPDAPDTPDAPDAPAPATTILIELDEAPALVAFRDGLDGAWRAAATTSARTFEAEVHGPYVVAVVCEDPARGDVSMTQGALTTDDEHVIRMACGTPAPPAHSVTGHMVQAGSVHIGSAARRSPNPGWSFTLAAGTGLVDLVAVSADRIARRAVAVDGDLALATPIDLDQEGQPLLGVELTATNATPAESLVASVGLRTAASTALIPVYRGPLAGARIAPDAALAATDAQSISVQATDGPRFRALRRPFRAGGASAFTLPPPIAGAQIELERDRLVGRWTALPPFDYFHLYAANVPTDETASISHYVMMSPRFAAATGRSQIELDTDLPGMKPAWRLDFTRAHWRGLFVQRQSSEIATSTLDELVDPAGGEAAGGEAAGYGIGTRRTADSWRAPPIER